jgi:CRISPR-associated exonuclease Cas4
VLYAEMFNCSVPLGAIFHNASKRRREVQFDTELRSLVIETIQQVRELLKTNIIPPPVADQRCPDCSLIDACLPYAIQDFKRGAKSNHLFQILGD